MGADEPQPSAFEELNGDRYHGSVAAAMQQNFDTYLGRLGREGPLWRLQRQSDKNPHLTGGEQTTWAVPTSFQHYPICIYNSDGIVVFANVANRGPAVH